MDRNRSGLYPWMRTGHRDWRQAQCREKYRTTQHTYRSFVHKDSLLNGRECAHKCCCGVPQAKGTPIVCNGAIMVKLGRMVNIYHNNIFFMCVYSFASAIIIQLGDVHDYSFIQTFSFSAESARFSKPRQKVRKNRLGFSADPLEALNRRIGSSAGDRIIG